MSPHGRERSADRPLLTSTLEEACAFLEIPQNRGRQGGGVRPRRSRGFSLPGVVGQTPSAEPRCQQIRRNGRRPLEGQCPQ